MCKKDPNTKVILTVRDSDATWWRSWCGFIKQEAERNAIAGFCIQGLVYRLVLRLVTCYFRLFSYLGIAGYLGPETQAMSVMQKHVVTEHLDQDVAEQAITVETVRLELSLKNST